MATDLHELLRSLRVWDPEVTSLPSFDPAAAPATPLELFTTWFAEAVAAGQTEPHTMSLAPHTPPPAGGEGGGRRADGTVGRRGGEGGGWPWGSHSHSRKGGHLSA